MHKEKRTETIRQERALLVGLSLHNNGYHAAESLEELAALAESAGATVVDRILQRRDRVDAKFYIGRGKVEEIASRVEQIDIDVIIFDDDLSPAQLREIEEICNRKVIDRSELILDIFASRAQTHEARLQVELAQLEYTAPRLRGMWTHLERIAGAGGGTGVGSVGGIGTRGPGERQIEIDRRIVSRRMTHLKRQIVEIDKRKIRQVQARHEYFNTSLIGYTNAGKSTLMNALTGAGVVAEDRLFATLDTKTRRWNLDTGSVLLSDTVGFIRRLPHHLIASFKATLEEAIHADLLLHVVDASSPTAWEQYEAVTGVLRDLDCAGHNTLVLLNKIDQAEDRASVQILQHKLPDAIQISAKTGAGLPELIQRVSEMIGGEPKRATVRLSSIDGRALAFLEKNAQVLERRYAQSTIEMDVVMGSTWLSRLQTCFPASQILQSA